jgi:hypothetical protein
MVATGLALLTRRSSDQKCRTILRVKKMAAKMLAQIVERKQVLA